MGAKDTRLTLCQGRALVWHLQPGNRLTQQLLYLQRLAIVGIRQQNDKLLPAITRRQIVPSSQALRENEGHLSQTVIASLVAILILECLK
jgi:hypothetical protein